MNTAVLILYIVVNGHMTVSRVPQPDLAVCEVTAAHFAQTAKFAHVECKTKKAPKAPKASA